MPLQADPVATRTVSDYDSLDHPEGCAMALGFYWADVARPSLAKLRESLDTTRHEVEWLFIDALAELLVAKTAGHLLVVQSM